MAEYACGLKKGEKYVKGRRPDSCKCAKLSSKLISLSGVEKTTQVLDEDKNIKCTMHTYYLQVENRVGAPLCNVGLFLDIRSLAKCGKKPWLCPGLCGDSVNEDCVQVLLSTAEAECSCECNRVVAFNGSGQFLCLPKLKPGSSIFTVVVTVCNDKPSKCPKQCDVFPALFSLQVKKCCSNDSLFCTSTLIGCHLDTVKFPKQECVACDNDECKWFDQSK